MHAKFLWTAASKSKIPNVFKQKEKKRKAVEVLFLC
jgi:hypothetical protein